MNSYLRKELPSVAELYRMITEDTAGFIPGLYVEGSDTLVRAIIDKTKEINNVKFRFYDFDISENIVASVDSSGVIEILDPAFATTRVPYIMARMARHAQNSKEQFADSLEKIKPPPGFCAQFETANKE